VNLKQLNILLADDDTDDCIFFKEALAGFSLHTSLTSVHNGEQLMELLTKKTSTLPHVLFLDLNMPRKNGFECLSEIKVNNELNGLPVIIFSTSMEQEVVNLLYKNGAQYYIRKPAEFSSFKKIIQQTLTLITQALSAGKAENIKQSTRENFVVTLQTNLAAEGIM